MSNSSELLTKVLSQKRYQISSAPVERSLTPKSASPTLVEEENMIEDSNPELDDDSPKDIEDSYKSVAMTAVTQRELMRQSDIICALQREYNRGYSDIKQKEQQLAQLQITYDGLRKQEDGFEGISGQKNAGQIFIEKAREEVKKMNLLRKGREHKEAVYRHMLHRLREQQLHERNVMFELRRKLEDAQKACKIHQDAALTAKNERYVAERNVEELLAKLTEERAMQKKTLSERKNLVQDKESMIHVREEQERRRQEILAASSGDLNNEQEEELVKTHATVKLRAQMMKTKLQQRANLVAKYEKAFSKIHHATGLRNANELIDKYLQQESKAKELKDAILEGEQTLEERKAQVLRMKQDIEEIRFSGLGHFNKQRKDLDQQEDKNNEMAEGLKTSGEELQMLNHVMRKVLHGVRHLHHLLNEIREPDGMQNINGPITDQNVEDCLQLIEAKGKLMLDRLDIGGASSIEEYIISKKKRTIEQPLVFVEAGDHVTKLKLKEAAIEASYNTSEDNEIELNEVDHIASSRKGMKKTTNRALQMAHRERKKLQRKSQAMAYSPHDVDSLVRSHINKAVFLPSAEETLEEMSSSPDVEEVKRETERVVEKKDGKRRSTKVTKRGRKVKGAPSKQSSPRRARRT
eukprot:g59.t1